MKVALLSKKIPAGQPKPRGRPKKQIVIEKTTVPESRGEVEEVAILMTESGSKITKPTLYDKAVNNPIHDKYWREAIKDKLQNLEKHQI